ncbi:hypothetical protein MNBD_NITROSPINAE03-549 [hydrothermal vent metagenome]|uniref:DUF5615 domain-containing protein n=1 Tax=hydrothermal vent metagenome TaxID=652676 RepID=A0A3B1BYP5_9ZZZZ
MIILADENIEWQIIERLRNAGHKVISISEEHAGIVDGAVLEIANNEKALLLTADRDFGELVYRQKQVSSGVLLVRLAGLPNPEKAELILSVITTHEKELSQAFTVVTPKMIRVRKK